MDQATIALIASGVALIVGLAGIVNSSVSISRAHRNELRLRFAERRSDGLLRLLAVVMLRSQHARDTIFNLSEARRDYYNEYTGENGDPYGPRRRNVEEVPRQVLSESASLLAMYGSAGIEESFDLWSKCLESCNAAVLSAEFFYLEEQVTVGPEHFSTALGAERVARSALESVVRRAISKQYNVNTPKLF
jgi:hypothetical protein